MDLPYTAPAQLLNWVCVGFSTRIKGENAISTGLGLCRNILHSLESATTFLVFQHRMCQLFPEGWEHLLLQELPVIFEDHSDDRRHLNRQGNSHHAMKIVVITSGGSAQHWLKEKGAFDKILGIDDLFSSKLLFIGRKKIHANSLNIIQPFFKIREQRCNILYHPVFNENEHLMVTRVYNFQTVFLISVSKTSKIRSIVCIAGCAVWSPRARLIPASLYSGSYSASVFQIINFIHTFLQVFSVLKI